MENDVTMKVDKNWQLILAERFVERVERMYIYQAEEIRHVDAEAERQGLSAFTLMENAGRGLFEKMTPLIAPDMTIGILSGKGNNGGDGIVLARYLKKAGFRATLMFPLGEPSSDVAKAHLDHYLHQGYEVDAWDEAKTFDVIVDAILGIGTRLPLRDDVKRVIRWANGQDALRIAIDVPTGLLSDRGHVETTDEKPHVNERKKSIPAANVFQADYTFSLHGAKPSAFLHPASAYYGKLDVVDIGVKQTSRVKVTERKEVVRTLPVRNPAGHKGTFGASLIVAGSDEMPGSVTLSAIGAIRSGTGRLIIATTERAIPVIASHVPEATFLANGLKRIAEGEIPEKLAAVGIGPGLVDARLTNEALDRLFQLGVPVVVDAGALMRRDSWEAAGPVVLTPHPGEFSRLTGLSVEEIENNRIELAGEFAEKHGVFVVLKGKHSVIAFPNGKVFINPTGNTGLAKGGSGDVLTGILVSFLATHDDVERAVVNAVFVHGLCADHWAKHYSEAAMTASDFHRLLPVVLKQLEAENE